MYIFNIASTIKKMLVNELRYFVFENYYKRIVDLLNKEVNIQ